MNPLIIIGIIVAGITLFSKKADADEATEPNILPGDNAQPDTDQQPIQEPSPQSPYVPPISPVVPKPAQPKILQSPGVLQKQKSSPKKAEESKAKPSTKVPIKLADMPQNKDLKLIFNAFYTDRFVFKNGIRVSQKRLKADIDQEAVYSFFSDKTDTFLRIFQKAWKNKNSPAILNQTGLSVIELVEKISNFSNGYSRKEPLLKRLIRTK